MPEPVGREWRQFLILSRDSVRRLLNTAFFGRETDPMPFALCAVALVATPPWMHAFRRTFLYSSIGSQPRDVVERFVLGDRLFFIVYGMVASALLAALIWEALLPDRDDQEIVGVLPVRPRTLAAARLAAAAAVAAAFATAISVPSGVIFAVISMSHPALGFPPAALFAHIVATTLGCLFVFSALLILRGVIAVCAGPRVTHGLVTILQIFTVVLLVDVFLFLPSVLPALVRGMLDNDPLSAVLPPVWFAGLYSWMVGTELVVLASGARMAVLAMFASGIVVVLVYLVSAGYLGRRALESLPRGHARGMMSLVRVAAPVFLRSTIVRTIFLFAVSSLARSRRHLFILATYIGFAVAIGGISLIAAGIRGTLSMAEPRSSLLALPLVLLFFSIFGLRAAFAIPTDVDANWPFRMSEPGLAATLDATRAVMLAVAVLPVGLLALIAAWIAGWPVATAVSVALCDVASGLLLVECVLYRWSKVPFTCAHAPAQETLTSRWPFFVLALNAFAFQLALFQLATLQSRWGAVSYVSVIGGGAVAVRISRDRTLRHATVQFEPPSEGLLTLGLSEAAQ